MMMVFMVAQCGYRRRDFVRQEGRDRKKKNERLWGHGLAHMVIKREFQLNKKDVTLMSEDSIEIDDRSNEAGR